jgi:hypothetical protein
MRSRKAAGAGDFTVTVPAASSAVAVAPAGTKTPIRDEAFFGSPTNAMFAATWPAVSGLPSAHVIPLRSVYVTVVVSPSHFSARPATSVPSGPTLSRES